MHAHGSEYTSTKLSAFSNLTRRADCSPYLQMFLNLEICILKFVYAFTTLIYEFRESVTFSTVNFTSRYILTCTLKLIPNLVHFFFSKTFEVKLFNLLNHLGHRSADRTVWFAAFLTHLRWIFKRCGASISVNACADLHVTVLFNVWIDLFSDVNMAVERRQAKPQSQLSPPRR